MRHWSILLLAVRNSLALLVEEKHYKEVLRLANLVLSQDQTALVGTPEAM